MNSIFRRRSIRQYTDRIVSDELLGKLLGAAMSAPSAGNERPWHFIVVKDKTMLERISGVHLHAGMIKRAAAAIIVCADLNLEVKRGMWVQDCSAATENILIEAEELGLGAVWVGIYPREERIGFIRELFGLPANIMPLSIVPVGYPAESFDYTVRFDGLRVHYEKW